MKFRRRSDRDEARVALIRGSGLFDPDWYLASNPDVAARGVEPALHYLKFGVKEGRFPNPLFDTRWYVERYRLGGLRRVNPLIDYWRRAASGTRDPNPYFSTAFYLRRNPDVAKSGTNPLVHFLRFGAAEGRDPSPSFSLRRYRELNPDAAGEDQLAHFLHIGRHQGRSPPRVEEAFPDMSRLRGWLHPGWARTEGEAKWGRRFRLAVFALGCAAYARHRALSAAETREPRMARWRFVRSAVRRFRAEGLQAASVSNAVLLTQAVRSGEQVDYTEASFSLDT